MLHLYIPAIFLSIHGDFCEQIRAVKKGHLKNNCHVHIIIMGNIKSQTGTDSDVIHVFETSQHILVEGDECCSDKIKIKDVVASNCCNTIV